MLSFWYYPEIDRFAVAEKPSRPDIEVVKSSPFYNGLDYYRYIPVDKSPVSKINEILQTAPREACFELTKACNLVCPICIAGANANAKSTLPYDAFVCRLKNLHPMVKRITLTGGEPTLLPDLPRFVYSAASNFEGLVIATNGFRPNEIEKALKGLMGLTVTVSLQGNRETHDFFTGTPGAFDKAIETVQRSLDLGHRVEILTTAYKESIQTLPLLVSQLSSLPIGEHRVNMIKKRGRILRSPAKLESVQDAIASANPPYKVTIKTRNQPFLFITSKGTLEQRDGK